MTDQLDDMTEAEVALRAKVEEQLSNRPKPGPPPQKKPVERQDPDRFLKLAKKVVVDNYNESRDKERFRELPYDGVYIVWFSKTLANWSATVESPIVRGLSWRVTCNGHRKEIYLDVFRKISSVVLEGEDNGRKA